MLIGIFLGTHTVGLYRTGHSIINMIYGLLFNSLLPVLFSVFSRMHNNLKRITNILLRVTKLFSFVSFPIAGFLFILQASFLDSFLGEKWSGIGQVLGWLGLMYGLSWTVGVHSTVYRSIGRPDINAKFMCLTMLYYLPVYYVSIQFGIDVFLKARLILTLVSILMHVVVARQFLSLKVALFLKNLRESFLAAASMAFFLFWMNRLNLINAQLWVHVLFNVLTGLCLYSLFSFREWPFVKEIVMSLLNTKKEA
jgi:O-antigen/teichoic acid export membrane protein